MEKFARTFMYTGLVTILATRVTMLMLDQTVLEVIFSATQITGLERFVGWEMPTGLALWFSNTTALAFDKKLTSKDRVYGWGIPLSLCIVMLVEYPKVAAMCILGVSFAGLFALHWLVNWREKRRLLDA